jgi:chromosome segregation ATPase
MYLFMWYIRKEYTVMDKELGELAASRAKQKYKAIFRKRRLMGLEKRFDEKEQEVRSLEGEISRLIDELQDVRTDRDRFHGLFEGRCIEISNLEDQIRDLELQPEVDILRRAEIDLEYEILKHVNPQHLKKLMINYHDVASCISLAEAYHDSMRERDAEKKLFKSTFTHLQGKIADLQNCNDKLLERLKNADIVSEGYDALLIKWNAALVENQKLEEKVKEHHASMRLFSRSVRAANLREGVISGDPIPDLAGHLRETWERLRRTGEESGPVGQEVRQWIEDLVTKARENLAARRAVERPEGQGGPPSNPGGPPSNPGGIHSRLGPLANPTSAGSSNEAGTSRGNASSGQRGGGSSRGVPDPNQRSGLSRGNPGPSRGESSRGNPGSSHRRGESSRGNRRSR